MAGDKSEKPTPQRLRKAREQGQFLVSRGFLNAIQFIVAVWLLGKVVTGWQMALTHSLPEILDTGMRGELTESGCITLLRMLFLQNLSPMLVFAGALLLTTIAEHMAVTKLGFSVQRLTPNFGRLSPASKLKDLPGQNLKSVIEAIALLAALTISIESLVEQNGAALLRLPLESTSSAVAQIAALIDSLLWKAAALFFVFGSVDLIRQQRKYMSQMKMSKQEVKQENKQQEGDPQMKGRIRRLRRSLMRKQMLRDTAKATAVVVNPTHFAVAIRYEMESMAAPVVVAKGRNWVALRIRQIAVENQVPVIENPPLARALYDAVEVGRIISPEFYKAIAEILAYVYRVMGRGFPRSA